MKSGLSVFIILVLIISSCKTSSDMDYSKIDYEGIPTVIYKTKADYSTLVPIVLNDAKTDVTSYPAPKDFYNAKGELMFPLPLSKGFYFDVIGVGVNTAYISITIDRYSHMIQAPHKDSLFKLIVEKDPFTKMYHLGNRKQYINEESKTFDATKVEEIVSSNSYKKYKRLK